MNQNNGAPGLDGITVTYLKSHMKKYYKLLKEKLKDGSYKPQPVKRVAIPKPDGSINDIRNTEADHKLEKLKEAFKKICLI